MLVNVKFYYRIQRFCTETINKNILQDQLHSCLRLDDVEVDSKTHSKHNFILSNEI